MSNLCGRNITSGTILISSWKTYSTVSTNVSVVDVQSILDDSLFNAYEFIYNQIPYYYVVDGSHNYWVSDLSSIGYKLYEEPSYEFILVDDSTGRVTHGVESLNQIEFSPTGYFLVESDNDVIFVVELPTVSITGDFDTNNWLYANTGGTNVSVLAGNSVLVGMGGSVSPIPVDYDTTKTYSVIRWGTYQSAQGSGHTEYSIINSNDKIYAKNVTSGDLYLYAIRVAVCSSNQASIVTVYDSSNIAYNAFKYTIDNIDYYYVLDETQTSWTNDLSSIGYSLTPPVVLPEVVLLGKAGYDYWLYVGATTANKILSSGSNCPLYSDRGSSSYGWTTYPKAVISCQKYENSEYWNVAKGRTGLSLVMSTLSGVQWPGCQNDLNESITFIRLKAAYCRNGLATVVTVYNSSNVAYNAFKYTASGTDYYYVLDGTQTDWTDDLSGIGYSLTPATVVAYLNSNKTAIVMQSGEQTYLRDGSGHPLEYDSTKTYSAYKYYMSSSDTTGMDATGIRIGYLSGWSYLMLTNNTGSQIQIQRVEYTVS